MTLNKETKLVFALEHVAHLHDLIKGNEYEHYLDQSLTTLEFELERQLANEIHRKNPKLETEYKENPIRKLSKRELELLDGSPIKSHEGMMYGRMYAEWKELIDE